MYYAEAMPKVGGRLAHREAGLAFSVESVYAVHPFAFHAAYKWITSEQMAELLEGVSRVYQAKTAEAAAARAAESRSGN